MELPPNLKISTMTATSKIKTYLNEKNEPYLSIEDLYTNLEVNQNIVYIDWAKNPPKGISPKQESDKKKKKKREFFNQITIVIVVENDFNNIKLFNNGAISMTGVKSEKNGKKAVKILVENLKNIPGLLPEDTLMEFFDIVWINSDYKCSYNIKRSELHQLLVNEYEIFSSFEPCIYQGVMSKFFWNKDYKDKPNMLLGKCYCLNECNGKGTGEGGDGNCKKITISAFQSGSVIIGAKTYEQIIDAYTFISGVFQDNETLLKKMNSPFEDIDDHIHISSNNSIQKKKEKQIYYIRKDNIVY
jgi:TATA-box binding protein (TBP) (component of TFIID and TFIIIB)